MKNLLFITIILGLIFPRLGGAGIAFPNTGYGTSDGVDIKQSTNINSQTAWTVMLWAARTQATIVSGNRIAAKWNAGGSNPGWSIVASGTGGNIRTQHKRATTNTSYETNTTPFANNGQWVFLAVSFNASGAAGSIFKVYAGTLTRPAQLQTLGTTTDGSGTFTYEGATDMCIGYEGCSLGGSQMKFAAFAYVNREMNATEIRGWQFRMRMVPNMQVWHIYSKRSGTTIFDQSRNGIVATSTATSINANDPPVIFRRGIPVIRR